MKRFIAPAVLFATLFAPSLATSASLLAQDTTDPALAERDDEIKRLEKEKALLEAEKNLLDAEKNLITQQKALADAKVKALGLPEFANTTTLSGTNAGKMEAMLLGSAAIDQAAFAIASNIRDKRMRGSIARPVVLLEGGDKQPWGDALTVRALIGYRGAALAEAIGAWNGEKAGEAIVGGGGMLATAALTAASKLFAQETTIGAIDFSATDQMLLRAVANRLEPPPLMPDALLFVAPDNTLLTDFSRLQDLVQIAESFEKKGAAGDKLTPAEDRRWKALQTELAGAKSLVSTLTTAKADGMLPLLVAARYNQLLADDALIAVVDSEFSGGSTVNKKDIATFFGADPLKETLQRDEFSSLE